MNKKKDILCLKLFKKTTDKLKSIFWKTQKSLAQVLEAN